MDKENTMGPGDDWEQAPPTSFYGENPQTTGNAQTYGCIWCLIDGVVDVPDAVLMYKGTVACMEHLTELMEAGTRP